MAPTLYLDTEFNGFGGSLISLALVPSDGGEEFYEVFDVPATLEPWVKENVVPILGQDAIGYKPARNFLHGYLAQFKEPIIVCDWHTDAEFFCQLLAGEDHGSSLDYDCTIRILRTPPNAYTSAIPHNALEDARALMRWHGMKKCA